MNKGDFMKKIFSVSLLLISMLLIQACGGGSSGGEGTPLAKSVENFSDISGVWNITVKENGVTDIAYAYIDNNGNLTIYDYLNDGYDNGADCYALGNGILTHNNADSFTDADGESFTAKLENNILILTYADHVERYTKETDLTKATLDSLSCENYGSNILNTPVATMKAKDIISIVYRYSKNICESQELKDSLALNLGVRNIITSSESNDVDCTTYDRIDNGSTCAENRDSTEYSLDTSCVIGADVPVNSKVMNKSYGLQSVQKGINKLLSK